MSQLIYALCALTSAAVAWLLLRSYLGTRFRLLLWSGLCFAGLAVNNALLLVDKLAFTAADLSTPRLVLALSSVLLLVVGLVLDSRG